MILVAYRHGLRISELVNLRWDEIDFATPPLRSAERSGDRQVLRTYTSLGGTAASFSGRPFRRSYDEHGSSSLFGLLERDRVWSGLERSELLPDRASAQPEVIRLLLPAHGKWLE